MMKKLPNVRTNYNCDNCIHEDICKYKRPEVNISDFEKALIEHVTGEPFEPIKIHTSDSPISFVVSCEKYTPTLSDTKPDFVCDICGAVYIEELDDSCSSVHTCHNCGARSFTMKKGDSND